MKTSDIVNKVFSKSFMGYDVHEVDVFLDELIVEVETLQRERVELTQTIEALLSERGRPEGIADARAALPQRKQLQDAAGQRHAQKPRRIASVSMDAVARGEGGVLTDSAISEITEAVALEIETGSAAPRIKSVSPEIRKVPQKTAAQDVRAPSAPSLKRNADNV